MKIKVAVGLSSGVDSTIAAYLLKQQGYEVIGVFMQNWDSFLNQENNFESDEGCSAVIDFEKVSKLGEILNIPIYKLNFVQEYWKEVFSPFLDEYKKGNTPNPDILCNKYIKFGSFIDACFKQFNVDYVATGHYAKVEYDQKTKLYFLKKAKDEIKDQTYFLNQLNQYQLSKVLFPLANYTKKEVKQLAKELNFFNYDQKESMGICFIGKRKFNHFLSNYVSNKKGPIKNYLTDETIGEHEGVFYYTIGQNKNLNLSGQKDKFFVIKKDVENNILYVTSKKSNEDFYCKSIVVKDINWITPYEFEFNTLQVKIRHSTNTIEAKIIKISPTKSECVFSKTQNIIAAPGQYCVFYFDDICLGGGVIENAFY